MHVFVNPARCCPECACKGYVFRGRKKVATDAEQPAAVETKSLCKPWGQSWKERVSVKEGG
jgi:hypothetical protein